MQLISVPLDKIEDVPAPTSKARQLSLLEVGQVHPIKLQVHNGVYHIVEGRRRVADLREAGQEEILALVEEMTDVQAAVQSLVSNITRSHNPRSEARDIGLEVNVIVSLSIIPQGDVVSTPQTFKIALVNLKGKSVRVEYSAVFVI